LNVITGSDHVTTEAEAIMGGENFAYMLEAWPGANIRVGAGPPHPNYIVNDGVIPFGSFV
jgi:hypothetical protein